MWNYFSVLLSIIIMLISSEGVAGTVFTPQNVPSLDSGPFGTILTPAPGTGPAPKNTPAPAIPVQAISAPAPPPPAPAAIPVASPVTTAAPAPAAVVATPVTAPTAAGATITVVADVWCPYNCQPDSPQPGYMIEIAKEALAKHNVTLNYQVVTWSIGITQVEKGEKDALIGVRKEESPSLIYPGQSIGAYKIKAYVRTGDSYSFTGPDSIQDKVLGIVQDYSYGADMDKYITSTALNKKLFIVSGQEPIAILVNNLLSSKLDVLLDDANVTAYYLKLKGLQDKVSIAGSVVTKDAQGATVTPLLYIAFAPGNPQAKQYADWIDLEIDAMRKSGRLAEILKPYGIDDWQTPIEPIVAQPATTSNTTATQPTKQ